MRNKERISRVDELISILSKKDYKQAYARAKAEKKCIICGKKALKFKSSSAEFEYNNSAICESCQSEYLQ